MITRNEKFEVADPSFYNTLISDQKKRAGKNPKNAAQWVELGRLEYEKAAMTKLFVQNQLLIRWLPRLSYLFLFSAITVYVKNYSHVLPLAVTVPALIFSISLITYMTMERYPSTGRRYFQKALFLDPSNADATMYLGLIALKKYQKKKAYDLLERACEQGGNKKLERELKTIYEKEFMALFNKKSDMEEQLCRMIEPLQDEIKMLKAEIEDLKSINTSAIRKAKSTKVKTGQTIRQVKMDMENQIGKIQNNYEKQIADLEQAMEEEEAQKEFEKKRLVQINLEILEAKALEKKQSFEQAAKKVEDIMGHALWMSLSKSTRSYMATAEHAFSILDTTSEETDFSLVGMELCKALETEINRKLVYPFAEKIAGCSGEFLKINKIGENKGLPVYFTMLAKVVDNQNYPETTSLSLGQYHFVLKKTLEGEYALDEYGNYLESILDSSKVIISRKFLQKLKIVTKDYRNSIVHMTHMNSQQCRNLQELVFLKKDSLLMECCKIN